MTILEMVMVKKALIEESTMGMLLGMFLERVVRLIEESIETEIETMLGRKIIEIGINGIVIRRKVGVE